MLPLLKAYSMRSVLIFDYIARLVSGALYIASVQYHHADSWGLPLLFASRVLYGMTLHSFGLPIIWAGVRLPEDQRGAQVAVLNALVALGIIIGPSIASVLCSLFTDEFMGYASPGYTTLALSAVLLGLTCAVDDGGVLPTNPPHAVPVDVAEEMQRVAKTMKLAGGVNSFLMMMTALAGFEAMFSILLYDGYGLIQREQTSVWAFFGLLSLCLGSLSPMAIQRLNSATQITGVACLGPPLVLSAINLTQYDTIVPLWRMFIGLVGIGISSQTYMIHLSAVSTRLPDYLQAEVSTVIQAAGQAGRALGPMLMAWAYEVGESVAPGTAVAQNAVLTILGLSVAVATYFPISFFKDMYGSFDELSAAQKVADKEKSLL